MRARGVRPDKIIICVLTDGYENASRAFTRQQICKRFAFGIPPQKNGDYAFPLHILACLKSNGTVEHAEKRRAAEPQPKWSAE